MMKAIFLIAALLISTDCWSKTAQCKIEIENVSSGTKYTVEQTFEFEAGIAGERKQFDLPGSNYNCTLTFFNLNSGTSLSCQLDAFGQNFIKSDRSAIEENQVINNLSFRMNSAYYVLKSVCE